MDDWIDHPYSCLKWIAGKWRRAASLHVRAEAGDLDQAPSVRNARRDGTTGAFLGGKSNTGQSLVVALIDEVGRSW